MGQLLALGWSLWILGSARRTGWKWERSIDQAVDDAGLEAVIRIAKGDRRRHSAVAAEHASATVSAAKRQLVLSLTLSLTISQLRGRQARALAMLALPDRSRVTAFISSCEALTTRRLEAIELSEQIVFKAAHQT